MINKKNKTAIGDKINMVSLFTLAVTGPVVELPVIDPRLIPPFDKPVVVSQDEGPAALPITGSDGIPNSDSGS